jgi:hypothetical protein
MRKKKDSECRFQVQNETFDTLQVAGILNKKRSRMGFASSCVEPIRSTEA